MSHRLSGGDGPLVRDEVANLLRAGAVDVVRSPSRSVRGAVTAEALRRPVHRAGVQWAWWIRGAAVCAGVIGAAAGVWFIANSRSSNEPVRVAEAPNEGARAVVGVPSAASLVRTLETAVRVEFTGVGGVRRASMGSGAATEEPLGAFGLIGDPVAQEARALGEQTVRAGKKMMATLPFSSLAEQAAARGSQP